MLLGLVFTFWDLLKGQKKERLQQSSWVPLSHRPSASDLEPVTSPLDRHLHLWAGAFYPVAGVSSLAESEGPGEQAETSGACEPTVQDILLVW